MTRVAVRVLRARPVGQLDRLRAEPHRAAEILDLLLLGEQVDHGMRRLGIHLGRVGAVEPDDVARELRDRDVHAEADAEVGNLPLAGDAAGEDLALPAARAEAAGDEDSVHVLELLRRLLERHPLRVDPAHAHRAALVQPRVLQRLVHRQVRVVELHVLADERRSRPPPSAAGSARSDRATRRGRRRRPAARASRRPCGRALRPGARSGRDRRRERPGTRSPPRARRRRRARSSRGCPARSPRASGRRRCPGGYRCAAAR